MKIIQKLSTTNTTAKSNRSIKYIVIHYTAGVTSAKNAALNTASWFSNASTKASADYIVDDNCVVQFNPDIRNRYTWHCGGSKYNTKGASLYGVCTNANSIGIELCSNNKTGKVTTANDSNWYFSDETIDNALELVKSLMAEYHIPPENVIRHYDVTGKICPGVPGWNADSGSEDEWDDFKLELIPDDETDVIAELEAEVELWKNKYIELKNKLKLLAEE